MAVNFSPTKPAALPTSCLKPPVHYIEPNRRLLHLNYNIYNNAMSIETSYPRKNRNGRTFAGIILLAVGGILLLNRLDLFFFPGWLISFPTFLIVLGLYIGAKNDYRKPAWLILVLIGTALLLDKIFEMHEFRHLIWPVLIIVLGLYLVFRRNRVPQHVTWDARMDNGTQPDTAAADKAAADPFAGTFVNEPGTTGESYNNTVPPASHDDFLDITSIFAGAKRTVLSKSFKGGDVVNVFGGTEIDLSQADINGRVIIDITQLFGGIKLIVPPHWHVVSELAAVFSGVDDKRRVFGAAQQSPDKVLVLKGTSILAGVDVRSY